MTGLDRKLQMVAVGLAAMAGMVDAIGFMASGGFFLSFMSGNSTRLAVGISQYAAYTGFVLFIISSFVCGVFAGSLTGYVQKWPDNRRQSTILLAIAAILGAVPLIAGAGYVVFGLCCAAFCMGAENTIFARKGAVTFGVTYMTGALVAGGDAKDLLPYLMLWAGLIVGAVSGALLFGEYGVNAIWVAAAISMVLAIIVFGTKSR
jgi:uncharacterized membrane protein YoaK (UPF0700 family)